MKYYRTTPTGYLRSFILYLINELVGPLSILGPTEGQHLLSFQNHRSLQVSSYVYTMVRSYIHLVRLNYASRVPLIH